MSNEKRGYVNPDWTPPAEGTIKGEKRNKSACVEELDDSLGLRLSNTVEKLSTVKDSTKGG